ASLRMKAENSAGVLVAGNRPEASAFALMAGSAKIFATSACSLSTMAGGVSFGATSPRQTVISSLLRRSPGMVGRAGAGRERARIELGQYAERPALDQRERRGRPVEREIHTPGEHALGHFGTPVVGDEHGVDVRSLVEQMPGELGGDGAGAVVELSGLYL